MSEVFKATYLVFLLSILWTDPCNAAEPYRIAIVYDERAIHFALEIAKTIQQTFPFNQLKDQLKFSWIPAESTKMNCRPWPPVPRIIDCNKQYIGTLGAQAGADKIIAVTAEHGGCGGGSMVTISKDIDPVEAIHELGHSIGNLKDEYEYSNSEAKVYCFPPQSGPNSAHFKPKLNSYPSDEIARKLHAPDIPWFAEIETKIPIVDGGSLGTPEAGFFHWFRNSDEAGLYPGGDCEKVIPTWHPFQGDNAMRDYGNGSLNIVQAKAVLKEMEKARRARFTGISWPSPSDRPQFTTGKSTQDQHSNQAQ